MQADLLGGFRPKLGPQGQLEGEQVLSETQAERPEKQKTRYTEGCK